MAPHIALHEVGATFESRPISLAKKETRTPAFLAINPEGKVPTLLIDGRALTEVAAILYYLAKRFPEAGLLPEGDTEARRRRSSVCRLSPRRSTRHAGSVSSAPMRCSRSPNRGWGRGTGRWDLLDCRHPSLSSVLALRQISETRAPDVPQPLRPLRPH